MSSLGLGLQTQERGTDREPTPQGTLPEQSFWEEIQLTQLGWGRGALEDSAAGLVGTAAAASGHLDVGVVCGQTSRMYLLFPEPPDASRGPIHQHKEREPNPSALGQCEHVSRTRVPQNPFNWLINRNYSPGFAIASYTKPEIGMVALGSPLASSPLLW